MDLSKFGVAEMKEKEMKVVDGGGAVTAIVVGAVVMYIGICLRASGDAQD